MFTTNANNPKLHVMLVKDIPLQILIKYLQPMKLYCHIRQEISIVQAEQIHILPLR